MHFCLVLEKTNIKRNNRTVFKIKSIEGGYSHEEKIMIDDNLEAVNIEKINKIDSKFYFKPILDMNCDVDEISEIYLDEYAVLDDNNDIEILPKSVLLKGILAEKMDNMSNIYNNIVGVVKGQDNQVKTVLSSIMWNLVLNELQYDLDIVAKTKKNLLLMGPTGVGKTEIVRQIAKNLDIPLVIVDATDYTEVGYVGASVNDMLEKLYLSADCDLDKCERGIIVIDEFDKLAKDKKENKSSVNKEGVQVSLLTMIEGTTKTMKINHSDINIYTHGITFILIGAFQDLYSSINKNVIGFNLNSGFRDNDDLKNKVSLENALEKYGIIPELLGRVKKIVKLNPMTKEILLEILKSRDGYLNSTINVLKELGIEVDIEDDILDIIAKETIKYEEGARALDKVIDKYLNGFDDAMLGNTRKLVLKKDK